MCSASSACRCASTPSLTRPGSTPRSCAESGRTAAAVREALRVGYRAIDTAALYRNEAGVGEALKAVPREDVHLTTKVWNTDQGYDATLRAFDASLARLGTDYVDLYLIHWPAAS